ncbi:MAG: DNA mismatch repair protein MutS [Ruminococcaceae bacterium]|nr:DNA mismatch repair protein MutS [Oscillospiraceae bacterium]
MAELTPMMKQYLEIKEQHKDEILFFRLGDFYEMFADDALTASRELDLTLTTRDRGKEKEDQTPMCGVPYHSSDGYIARLIAKGYKVAICEQTEDPALAKGLVKRDIIRVVTPGTVIDSQSLDSARGNFLAGVFLDRGTETNSPSCGVAFCDMSTGETHVTAFSGADCLAHLMNELSRFTPAEAVVNDAAYEDAALTELLRQKLGCAVERADKRFDLRDAEKSVLAQYGEDAYQSLPRGNPAAVLALGGLLSYLHETQKTDLAYIDRLEYYESGRFMELDLTARRNLELTETLRGKDKRGSLLWVLDKTKTAMGARCLRAWLERPLRDVNEIDRRLGAVETLARLTMAREELIVAMTGVADMERLIGRIVYGTAGGRDFASLRASIERLGAVKEQLKPFTNSKLVEIYHNLDTLDDVASRIRETLVDEPPFSVREGGFIRPGFNAEVDRLHGILSGGKDLLVGITEREKEKTGIRTLKIGYNKVFGYYIEVSNSFKDQVPDTYIRKQTLVNGERYVTQELKDLEQEILTAGERVNALEYELFTALRDAVAAEAERIQKTAAIVAELDSLCSFAHVAVQNNYCRPTVDDSGVIEIHDGRHPVVERVLKDTLFVPNDTYMGEKENRVSIITGPNMAGKSTYMRQVALIALMAQVGSFVPAKSARIGVVDRIFTRIGASDDLAGGQSTFMVEMSEVAEILRAATPRSLLILDEIGRGTSTFDGMSIARAVLEHCASTRRLGAKTLFATHYHELTELENTLPGVKNYNISIKKRGDELIFLRKIIPGGADRSYGIEVATLAGLPKDVVTRAKAILAELERGKGYETAPRREEDQLSMTAIGEAEVLDRLRRAQPETMTPIEAMQLLYELRQRLQ